MNEYFANITKTLDIKDYQPDTLNSNKFSTAPLDDIGIAINKFKRHPSIQKIKSKTQEELE